MNQPLIKTKQIENILSQKIKSIYEYKLEHQLESVFLKISNGNIIVIMKGTMTCPEKLLQNNDRTCLAKKVRETIDLSIKPHIRTTIEEVLNVKVVDFLSDTTIETNYTGIIAILEFKPKQVAKSQEF